MYKFTLLATSVLYKNTIHICSCVFVLEKIPKILYITTDWMSQNGRNSLCSQNPNNPEF